MGSVTPSQLGPIIRVCMDAGYRWGRPPRSVVTWADAQAVLREWAAEARGDDPKRAAAAARKLWVRAIEGEDMRIALADLEDLCASPEPDVRFFASCAWRIGLRRKRDLPPLRPGRASPKPDVRHTRRWRGMNTEVRTARRSQFRAIARTPARQKPAPGEHACGVCAGPETTRIFFEDHGGPDYKWRIWEVRCAECGCYSLYSIDD